MTWVINSGGGKISFEVQMSATDNIFNATNGAFVALYTSTSNGKFDVNACPEEGGIAQGTYTFQTKHEMTDVSGAANARSGAARSVDGPFTLYNGDDAHLLRIETTLDMKADAHSDAFDWTATQTMPIVMSPSGATTSEGGSGLSAQGTGAERSAGSMFVSSAMAQLLMAQIGRETETFWRSGKCIELTPSRESGSVTANEQVDLSVTAAGKFQPTEIDQPISATFTGAKSLDPTGEPVPYPPTFTFIAGPNDGDKGTINLEQVSNRGIGKKTVEYTVGSAHFGGTIHYDELQHFLAATTTFDITVEVVLLVDGTGALTVEDDGGGTYSYDFDTTGGNSNAGTDCEVGACDEPPCSSHGEGMLVSIAQLQQGSKGGLLQASGALGDDLIRLRVVIPIKCGEKISVPYVLSCDGGTEGLKAKHDSDDTYRIDASCHWNLDTTGPAGAINNGDAHAEGTLAPLDASPPTP